MMVFGFPRKISSLGSKQQRFVYGVYGVYGLWKIEFNLDYWANTRLGFFIAVLEGNALGLEIQC